VRVSAFVVADGEVAARHDSDAFSVSGASGIYLSLVPAAFAQLRPVYELWFLFGVAQRTLSKLKFTMYPPRLLKSSCIYITDFQLLFKPAEVFGRIHRRIQAPHRLKARNSPFILSFVALLHEDHLCPVETFHDWEHGAQLFAESACVLFRIDASFSIYFVSLKLSLHSFVLFLLEKFLYLVECLAEIFGGWSVKFYLPN